VKTKAATVPPDSRPCCTSIAACHMTSVIDPNIRPITIAVITARSTMRRFAVPNAFSTAPEKRLDSRPSCPKAWTIFIAPERLGDDRADIGDAVLTGAGGLPHALGQEHDRQDDDRNAEQQESGELGCEREQVDDAADAHDEVAQRDGHGLADHELDHRRVGGQARGDLGRAVLLEEARLEPEQVAMHFGADVGNDALAQPGDEIEAGRGGERQYQDDPEQIIEMLADIAVARGEALVDDAPEAVGDCQRPQGRDQQGEPRTDDLAGVADRGIPDHPEVAELAAGWSFVLGVGHRVAGLAAPAGALNASRGDGLPAPPWTL
jgi:hypothetical protein